MHGESRDDWEIEAPVVILAAAYGLLLMSVIVKLVERIS